MARIKNSILNGFSGKVGDIVGCMHKSGFYIRRRPAKSTKPATLKQLAQRHKFKLAQEFLSGLRELFKTLPNVGEKHTFAYGSALGHIVREAITGEFPEQLIDYAAVKLTTGLLHRGCEHSVSAGSDSLNFSWCRGKQDCIYQDLAVVLAYSPLTDQWIYQIVTVGAGCRTAKLNLPFYFQGDQLETWLYFFSFNGESVSNSVYTGSYLIPLEAEFPDDLLFT